MDRGPRVTYRILALVVLLLCVAVEPYYTLMVVITGLTGLGAFACAECLINWKRK